MAKDLGLLGKKNPLVRCWKEQGEPGNMERCFIDKI